MASEVVLFPMLGNSNETVLCEYAYVIYDAYKIVSSNILCLSYHFHTLLCATLPIFLPHKPPFALFLFPLHSINIMLSNFFNTFLHIKQYFLYERTAALITHCNYSCLYNILTQLYMIGETYS